MKHRRTKRTIDDECGIDALENLEILDLIKAADKNESCSKVAADVFQKYFAKNDIVIEKYPNAYGNSNSYDYDSSTFEESIANLQAATAMISHFGHLIQKLAISFSIDDSLCEQPQMIAVLDVLKAIDERCRKSLVKFELDYRGCNVNNVFNQIQGPFEHVEILNCNLYDMNRKTNGRHFQLNTVFPNIRQLQIHLHHLSDPSFIGCEFPKLESLDITNGLSDESIQSMLIDLLKKNPQITSVSLNYPTYQALQHVKTHLTHLEELNIDTVFQEEFNSGKTHENEEIQFPMVKRLHLQIEGEQCRLPSGISFDETELQNISLICNSGNHTDEYLNFLLKYPKIQKLEAGIDMHSVVLMKLTGKFPELSHAVFGFHEDVTVDNIIEFIKKTPKLQQMEFFKEHTKNDAFTTQLLMKFGTELDIKFGIRRFKNEILPSKKVLKYIYIERNAAYLFQNAIHITVIMFMIAYASRFLFH